MLKEEDNKVGITLSNEPRYKVEQLLKKVIDLSDSRYAKNGRNDKMNRSDLMCLAYLHRKDAPCTPSEIIEFLGLTSGSGTALIDRLENAGYISRSPNPQDRRSVLISLDRDAAQKPLDLLIQREKAMQELLLDFSADEIDVILRFLNSVVGQFEA